MSMPSSFRSLVVMVVALAEPRSYRRNDSAAVARAGRAAAPEAMNLPIGTSPLNLTSLEPPKSDDVRTFVGLTPDSRRRRHFRGGLHAIRQVSRCDRDPRGRS